MAYSKFEGHVPGGKDIDFQIRLGKWAKAAKLLQKAERLLIARRKAQSSIQERFSPESAQFRKSQSLIDGINQNLGQVSVALRGKRARDSVLRRAAAAEKNPAQRKRRTRRR